MPAEKKDGYQTSSIEAFNPQNIVVCPRQNLRDIQIQRLYQQADKRTCINSMLPNALAVYREAGRLRPVHEIDGKLLARRDSEPDIPLGTIDTENNQRRLDVTDNNLLKEIHGAYVVPVSPWGNLDIMHIHFNGSNKNIPALTDIPQNLLSKNVATQRKIIELFGENGHNVFWGVNNSAGCIKGEGLMSVLFPHSHIWRFDDQIGHLNSDDVKKARDSQKWDSQLSMTFADRIGQLLAFNILPEFWPDNFVRFDPMGLTVDLRGFTPDDFNNDFIEFWRKLSLTIHWGLRNMHSQIFDSDLDEIIDYVLQRDLNGFNEDYYKQFFTLKPDAPQDNITSRMAALSQQNQLRLPPGWAATLMFTEQETLLAVTFGFLNIPMGPVEGLGIRLERPPNPEPAETMKIKRRFYEDIVSQLV
jgi:hypothetical protein